MLLTLFIVTHDSIFISDFLKILLKYFFQQKTEHSATLLYILYNISSFGICLEPLYIFELKKLGQWAITPSFKDSCLQAYLLTVKA